MVAKRPKGKIVVSKPYKTRAAAVRTLSRLKATRTHMVIKRKDGLYTIRKKSKRR